MRMDALRASPDALLAAAEREGRGKLRIFLGAAPGVGKTFAMLQAARAARAAGTDVVIGIVETHGRAETAALTEGLEVLPRHALAYRGTLVPEFDLAAALRRRPALLVLDEFAHSNAPGSLHPKRWQDAQDLIAAGIDVWTTLNIQHVESLNEVVQRITGVRVRETVPDTVLSKADEMILVDLPPDELLKRLADGKVYVEDAATRALRHFFKPSNLTALRELALRRVAAQVDSDLLERMRGGAIEGPWAAAERLLVCVGPDAAAERVVREGRRLADLMQAEWFAVTVERPGGGWSAAERLRLDTALRLAETLGATCRSLVGNNLAGEILRFSRFENVTQILIARAAAPGLRRWFGRTLAEALVRGSNGISVHVVTAEAGRPEPRRLRLPAAGPWRAYAAAIAGVAAATGLGELLTERVALPNVSMLFLLAVLVPAIRSGVWPAVFASVLSALAYNFFFISPFYTLTIARPHEVLALAIFLIIAVIISALAGRAREQERAAAVRMRATRRLYEFTRTLSALPAERDVAEAVAAEAHASAGRASVVLVARAGELELAAAWPPDDRLDTASRMAAHWAHEHGEPAGNGTGTLPSVPWLFLPLAAGERHVGVLGIERATDGAGIDGETLALVATLAEQATAALIRAGLAGEVARAKADAETERVRNILLASISHDFRTPLASVLGAATSLIEYGPRMPQAARDDLLAQIREEAERLDAMVRNLLSMTRLEAGALDLRRGWVDLAEVVERVVAIARRRGAPQHFEVRLPAELPLVHADQGLLDQALGNIVQNAVRYAGPAAHILFEAAVQDDAVHLTISDDGPGIKPDLLPVVFDKFVRAPNERADGGEGAGLGLAIARGVIEAHGGSIKAFSPVPGAERGTRIGITLPVRREVKDG
ncbi:MAG TPA: sensor histidine kinase KdpD [Xanthobacteraceae bacterium]|nr:sensor histidine kinase KdpD [Xanthobacteraceae bacterium]